jgi:transcriptional regulator with PAS, ATPase and Fis domain
MADSAYARELRASDNLVLKFILVAEETVLEEKVLSPWESVVTLPEKIFYPLPQESAFSLRPDLIQELKVFFNSFIFPEPKELTAEDAGTDISSADPDRKLINDAVLSGAGDQGMPKEVSLLRVAGQDENSFEKSSSYDTFGDWENIRINDARIILKSAAIREVFDRAKLVAPTDATVLVTGESGTGKELVAHMVHFNSKRKEKNFLRINCASISQNLIESELFGYEKGAFTGALGQKKGYFEATHGGTLFLDEIGELSLALQAKLLRVLEHGEVLRVGGVEPFHVNVRMVAATNRDLKTEVSLGKFREDLFYRLNVIRIYVPPLRDRKEDIPPLFNHFISICNKRYDKKINSISLDAKRLLLNYPWPGNVRELKNLIEGLVILKKDLQIRIFDFPIEMREMGIPKLDWQGVGDFIRIKSGVPLKIYEKEIIRENLKASQGNRKECALVLGISERTLYRKIKEYGLDEL